MSTTTYAARPTTSVVVSGPSPHLAMLRALIAKARRALTATWLTMRSGMRAAVNLPRAVADTTLAILATDRGYATVTGLVGAAAQTAGRLLARSLRWAGRRTAALAQRAAEVTGLLLPNVGQAMSRGVTRVQEATTDVFHTAERVVRQGGDLVAMLTRSNLVREVTTRLAAAASGLLALHLITQGAVATKIVTAIPAAVHLVAWATNPWALLAGLGIAFGVSVAFAAVRLWTAGTSGPDDSQDGSTPSAARTRSGDEAFDDIVARLRVAIDADGSVRVHGVPADLPEDEQRDLAAAAARAAVSQLERLARHGRPISSAQRRAATKAARVAARTWLSEGYLATA